jgi:hypothetical protein
METSQVQFAVLVFILLIVVFIITNRLLTLLQRQKSSHLQQKGKRVVAIVTNIRQEVEERGPAEFPRINYCYYIEAEWTDIHTGATYSFRSKRLSSRPIEEPGAFLSVVVDAENPKNYEIDLSEDHI